MLPNAFQIDRRFSAWAWPIAWLLALSPSVGLSADALQTAQQWKPVPAKPYLLRGADRRLLDRVERFLADEQWEDAIAGLLRLSESESTRVVPVGQHRFVSLSEYCNRLLTRLPAEPLARYRQLVDGAAESWLRQGIEQRDQSILRKVADRYFCSSWGDDALFAIGELALQRGHYQAARDAWMHVAEQGTSPDDRPRYPDSDLPTAAVAARLVLTSIREGNWPRAEGELAKLKTNYSAAKGRLGGRNVVFVDHLEQLMLQAQRWPIVATSDGWRTYAENFQRTNPHLVPDPTAAYELVWSQPLDNETLTTYPVAIDELVICQDSHSVRALHLLDGREIFVKTDELFRSPKTSTGQLGRTEFTLTVTDRYVFGVSAMPLGPSRRQVGSGHISTLWCLDLEREGALAFAIASDDSSVAFAGAPIVDETFAFVPIRSNDQTARSGIACYDLSTGEPVWQRWICQSNTPATGRQQEFANNLLAYDSGVLYANTNLGAVAAVRAEDGQLLWLRTYPRFGSASDANRNAYYRGSHPCLCYHGAVFVLPTDSNKILALDASTGALLWTSPVTSSTARLIGVDDECLWSYDDGRNCIDRVTGKQRSEVAAPRSRTLLSSEESQLPASVEACLAFFGEYVVAAERDQLSVLSARTMANEISEDENHAAKE